jgi:DNA-binding NtrC family response regulator
MPPEASGSIRVLVVDDEEEFALATATRLRRRGFDASTALSGRAAIDRLSQTTVDVVILDLRMPGMDGLDTLRSLRRLDPEVQVVFLTGHGTVASGIEGMQLGAADFLQKPVDFETLCNAINVAAERGDELRSTRQSKGERT